MIGWHRCEVATETAGTENKRHTKREGASRKKMDDRQGRAGQGRQGRQGRRQNRIAIMWQMEGEKRPGRERERRAGLMKKKRRRCD
jgi:hypothetical protein